VIYEQLTSIGHPLDMKKINAFPQNDNQSKTHIIMETTKKYFSAFLENFADF
jgi:hypothetical protein